MTNSLPFSPQQLARLQHRLNTPECTCPVCKMRRGEIPTPSDFDLEIMLTALETFDQLLENQGNELEIRELKTWLRRMFILGFACGKGDWSSNNEPNH